MARKHHRFGRLHQTLKDTGYTATTGPAGEYFNYLQGKNKLTVPRKPGGQYLVRFNVGVIPFGVEPSTATGAINSHQATMTVLGDNIRTACGTAGGDTAFGIERDLAKTTALFGFYAAQARISLITNAATKAAKTSQITKRAYKAYPSRTGSVPYGRTTTGVLDAQGQAVTDTTKVTDEDVRTALLKALKDKAFSAYKCIGVSFVPEAYPEIALVDVTKPTGTGVPSDIPAN